MKPAAMRLKAQPQAVQAQQAPAFLIAQRAHQQAALQALDPHLFQALDPLAPPLFPAHHFQDQLERNFTLAQHIIAVYAMEPQGKGY